MIKNPSKAFAISKAISKIGEIGKRHGDRSTGFKIPLTAKNIRILKFSTEINNAVNESGKKFIGQVVEDEVVIGDGYRFSFAGTFRMCSDKNCDDGC